MTRIAQDVLDDFRHIVVVKGAGGMIKGGTKEEAVKLATKALEQAQKALYEDLVAIVGEDRPSIKVKTELDSIQDYVNQGANQVKHETRTKLAAYFNQDLES